MNFEEYPLFKILACVGPEFTESGKHELFGTIEGDHVVFDTVDGMNWNKTNRKCIVGKTIVTDLATCERILDGTPKCVSCGFNTE